MGLLAGVLCVAFETVAVATAMPAAAQELGQVHLYAWTFTLFVLGMIFSTAVAGRLSDRWGPVKPLALGGALFLLGLAVAGAATSMPLLVAARFLQGLGGGALNLCLMVVVATAFEEAERASIMTWFSVCWVLPAFLGPPIAAAITHRFGWHWVFWGLVPALLGAAALAARPLAELARKPVDAQPDTDPVPLWAALVAALAVAGLQMAGHWMGWRGAVLALVSLAALVVAVPRLMPPGFLRMRAGLSAVVWTRACQAGAFFGAETFLPLSLVQLRGLSLFQAGLALTIGSVGWTTGSWVQARPWLRLRRDQIIGLGMVCTLVGLVGIAVGTFHPDGTLAMAALGWTIGGFGMGLSVASSSLAVMALSSPARLGRNTSSLQTAEGLGNSLVAGLAGTIFHTLATRVSDEQTFGWIFTAAAVVMVLGMVAALRIGPVRNVNAQ